MSFTVSFNAGDRMASIQVTEQETGTSESINVNGHHFTILYPQEFQGSIEKIIKDACAMNPVNQTEFKEHLDNVISNKVFLPDSPKLQKVFTTISPLTKEVLSEEAQKKARLEKERKEAIKLVTKDSYEFIKLSQFHNDREILSIAIASDPRMLGYASEDLQNDREIVLKAIELTANDNLLPYVSETLQNDMEIVLKAVAKSPDALDSAGKDFRTVKELVIKVLEKNGCAIRHVSKDLQEDQDVLLTAVGQDGYALSCLNEKGKDNKEVVKKAVAKDGHALQWASKRLREDRDVVLIAVANRGNALKYASTNLQDDIDVVQAAMASDGRALRYASEKMRDTKEVVIKAVAKIRRANGNPLEYASEEMKRDRDVVLRAVEENGDALEHAHPDLQGDREIVLKAITQRASSFHYASQDLQNDLDFIMLCIAQNYEIIATILRAIPREATEQQRSTRDAILKKEFILKAIAQNDLVFFHCNYLLGKLKEDQDLVHAAKETLLKNLKSLDAGPERQRKHGAMQWLDPEIAKELEITMNEGVFVKDIKRETAKKTREYLNPLASFNFENIQDPS